MKAKGAVAILLLAVLAASTMLVKMPAQVKAAGVNQTYITLSDVYMSNTTAWAKRWGTGTVTITDIAGPGVQFDFDGADKVGVADDYLVEIPGVGEDLTGYDGYELYVKNIGVNGTNVHLFMNTGHTAGGVQWKNDTFWGGPWVWLNPGETKLYTLNFSNAEAWNADDDPVVEWRVPGGNWTTVKRLHQVTKIGFETDPTVDPTDISVVAFGSTNPELYVNPPTVSKDPAHYPGTFPVDIVIENFTDFYGFEINMTWDSDLLDFGSVAYSAHLDTLWGSGSWSDLISSGTSGSYKLVATKLGTGGVSSTGAYTLFTLTLQIIEVANTELSTAIHFEVIKLSDSATPVPNKIVPGVVTDGMYYMSGSLPTIAFVLVEPDSHPWEYGKNFSIEVWLEDVEDFSPLEDYNLTMLLTDPGLAKYKAISWSTFGAGDVYYTAGPPDLIRVECAGGPSFGDIKLFTLDFNITYDASQEHVWKHQTNEQDAFGIELDATAITIGLTLGDLDDVIDPAPQTIDVYFIRGDVDSDGLVGLYDLGAMGYYYGLTGASIYDLTGDLIVDIYDVVALATNYLYGNP